MSDKKAKPSKAKVEAQLVISHNEFVGVKFDAKAVEAIIIVARGLLNLTEVFKVQGIHIDTLLTAKTDGPKVSFTTTDKKLK